MMYDYLNRDNNPFPPVVDVCAPNVVCCYSYQGAAYANVGDSLEWHVDFLNSHGSIAIACQNVQNGRHNYTVYGDVGYPTVR